MKKTIRHRVLKERRAINPAKWERNSKIIQDKFISCPWFKKAVVIFTYVHFDREVKTDIIMETAWKEKKKVCIPRTDWEGKKIIPSLLFSTAELSKCGKIPQPKILREFPAGEIDLVIVPGVVFDNQGNRIGTGEGFFDRFLPLLPAKTPKIALAFEIQISEKLLPAEQWDVKMDVIITEKRTISL
jgi:5-formyltetrahydrofolate cyclo-ligase